MYEYVIPSIADVDQSFLVLGHRHPFGLDAVQPGRKSINNELQLYYTLGTL